MNIIDAIVTIKSTSSGYSWTYSGTGIDPDTGLIKLANHNPTQITYTLCPETQQNFSFSFVNLSTAHAVTRQITSIQINAASIVIQDENLPGRTETTPFGFLLIARPRGEISTPVVSPDPVVVNDPGPRPPCE